jgi:branched-chain amino acid transport system ATP-binding protein
VNVYYGNIYAVKDVAFHWAKAKSSVSSGPNGAGKSTILRRYRGCCAARPAPIEFMGQNIAPSRPHKNRERGLAHVPEGRRIFLRRRWRKIWRWNHSLQPKAGMSERLEEVFEQFPRLKERRRQSRAPSRREQADAGHGAGLMREHVYMPEL